MKEENQQEQKENNETVIEFPNKIIDKKKFINLKFSNQQPYLIPKAQTSNLYYKQSFEKQQNAENNTFNYLGNFQNISDKNTKLDNFSVNPQLKQKQYISSAKYKKVTDKQYQTFEEFIQNKTFLNQKLPNNLLQTQSFINNNNSQFELEKILHSQSKAFKKREISGNFSEHSRLSSSKNESTSFVVAMKALQGKIKRMESEMDQQMQIDKNQKINIIELEQIIEELQIDKKNLLQSNQQYQKINEDLLASYKVQQQQILEVNQYQIESLKTIKSLEKNNKQLIKTKTKKDKDKNYEEQSELQKKINELNEIKLKLEIQYTESIGKFAQFQEQNNQQVQTLNQTISELTQKNTQLTFQKKLQDEKFYYLQKHLQSLTENQEKQINSLSHTNQILQAKNNELEQKLIIYEKKLHNQLFELQKFSKMKGIFLFIIFLNFFPELKSRCNRKSIELSEKMVNQDSYQLQTDRTNIGDTSTQSETKEKKYCDKENLNLNQYKRKLAFENEASTPRKTINDKKVNQQELDKQFQVLLSSLQQCNVKQTTQLKEQLINLVNKQENNKNILRPTDISNQLPNNFCQQL